MEQGFFFYVGPFAGLLASVPATEPQKGDLGIGRFRFPSSKVAPVFLRLGGTAPFPVPSVGVGDSRARAPPPEGAAQSPGASRPSGRVAWRGHFCVV